MAMVTGMDPEAGDVEAEQPLAAATPAAAAVDADLLAKLVAQAVAAQNRPWRSALLTASATTILAGLIAVAAAGYTALRADITAMRAELSGVETGLRAEIGDVDARLSAEIDGLETRLRTEIQEFRAEVNASLLDHTDRLARLETDSQHHTERLARLETDSQHHTEQLAAIESALQLGHPAQ